MQIHELNTFSGTPGSSDYLVIDNGTETTELPASNIGISMTQAEATAGTSTAKRVVTPKIFKSAVTAIVQAFIPVYITEQGTSNGWDYRKWSDGTMECWRTYSASIAVNTQSSSYGGYRSGTLNIPTFPVTFTAVPSVTATVNSSGGIWLNNVIPTTTGGTFFLSCGSSNDAATRSIAFYVIGK